MNAPAIRYQDFWSKRVTHPNGKTINQSLVSVLLTVITAIGGYIAIDIGSMRDSLESMRDSIANLETSTEVVKTQFKTYENVTDARLIKLESNIETLRTQNARLLNSVNEIRARNGMRPTQNE